MMITQEVFDRVTRKNGRARKRMAVRYMRKAYRDNVRAVGAKAAQCKRYAPLELELNRIISRWSAKTMRTHAHRMKDINKSVESEMLREIEGRKRRYEKYSGADI